MLTKHFPDSTNVTSLSYEGTTLTVEFRGTGKYQYYDIPQEMFDAACKAESIGKWINDNLVKQTKFKWRKI